MVRGYRPVMNESRAAVQTGEAAKGAIEADPAGGEPIDVGRAGAVISVRADDVGRVVVGTDPEDVQPARGVGARSQTAQTEHNCKGSPAQLRNATHGLTWSQVGVTYFAYARPVVEKDLGPPESSL